MYLLRNTASVTHNAYLFDCCGLELHVFIAVVFVVKFARDVCELRGHVLLVVQWLHHWFGQGMRPYFRLGIQVVRYNKVRRWLHLRLELVGWLLASQVRLVLFGLLQFPHLFQFLLLHFLHRHFRLCRRSHGRHGLLLLALEVISPLSVENFFLLLKQLIAAFLLFAFVLVELVDHHCVSLVGQLGHFRVRLQSSLFEFVFGCLSRFGRLISFNFLFRCTSAH